MSAPRPYGLLAELTHWCPLSCPYCSNPLELAARRDELPAETWVRVLAQAAELGVVQVGFSGGEPLLYRDLPRLVATARAEGMYSNLITSGVGLDAGRIAELRGEGLDAVQISLQADEASLGDEVAGAAAHARKLVAARAVVESGLPLGLNVVLHRRNIDRLEAIIALAASLGAMRLELANTQFYGWAFRNRAALIPTRDQVLRAERIAAREAARFAGRMQVIYVLPDYHERRPKPCLHGWGARSLTVNPRGDALPCQAANAIPGLAFDNVRAHSLAWIWREGDAFNRFRGFDWMPEPCRSCPERERDFGGCRCQAALLAGDAARTDPVCEFSPDRPLVDALLADAARNEAAWTYRG
ncbi:MAG: pyrroloquinoline quinone biosynthesis protein PqqE [Terrimicrobiaceae bacterium]|nr:pyrroloquinoline quinone biosynthesis protein PqqE [Terrimicrobiaceae bacterium]